MSSQRKPVGLFDHKRLAALAVRFREEEASAALTVSAASRGDLSRQPKLAIRSFAVSAAQAAVSPDCSYRLLVAALESAKRSITAYVYNIGAPFLLDILKAKHAAKVKVRVMVDANDPNDKKSREYENLEKMGIEIKLAPSSGNRRVFTVCHQKYVVIDGKVTVVESANWSESAFPRAKKVGEYKPGNREWLLRVDDKGAAAWFESLFEADWDIPETAGLGSVAPSQVLTAELQSAALFVAPKTVFDIKASTQNVRLLPIISPVNYLDEVGKAIKKASGRVYVQQQYIKAGDGVNELLEILHERAKTCDVRIIVSPRFVQAWEATIDTLRAAGLLRKLRAQNLKHVIHGHNKGVIVDDDQTVVSSTNWSENSIMRAREVGFLIASRELTSYYASVFEQDWQDGIAQQRLKAQSVALPPSEMF